MAYQNVNWSKARSADDPLKTMAEVAEAALVRRYQDGLTNAIRRAALGTGSARMIEVWSADLAEVRRDIRAAQRQRELGGAHRRR